MLKILLRKIFYFLEQEKLEEILENLVKHTKHEQITLINRTKEKAEKLAKNLMLL